MAHAYIPGLRVTDYMTFEVERRLPLKGRVLVQKGQVVTAETVVARTELPGNVIPVNLANQLGVPAADVEGTLIKPIGSSVQKDEVFARVKTMFGLMSQSAKSPANGVLESISSVTGQVILREPPMPVEVDAYVNGTVKDVIPDEGVTIEAKGAFIQGIFGIGGETRGTLKMLVSSPSEVAAPEKLDASVKGCVVVVGAYVSNDFLNRAIQAGASAVVAGGIDDKDLRDFLGYDLGVAITGHEEMGITVLVTEGFGHMPIAERTFRLLKALDGKVVSVNGATQIRAGVMRPEILCPLDGPILENQVHASAEEGLKAGANVRVIRQPYFGKLGTVVSLPAELQMLETEAHVRVVEVEFGDGSGKKTLPRANVEMIET